MPARLLAVVGAIVMPVSLFFDWYQVGAGVFSDRSMTLDGWEVFETTDAVMVLAAVATVVLVVSHSPSAGWALMMVGSVATVFVGVVIVNKPALYGLFYTPQVSLEIGAWLGLLGALLILLAGVLKVIHVPPDAALRP